MAPDSTDPKPTLPGGLKHAVRQGLSLFVRPGSSSPEQREDAPRAGLTASEVLSSMEGADETRLAELASEPACPEATLIAFVNGPSAALRAGAARNPRLNPGLLTVLVQNDDEDEAVLLAVAEHPAVTQDSLRRLAENRHATVRLAVALHPSASPDTLTLLAASTDAAAQVALASRPDLPLEVQRILLQTGNSEVRRALVTRPNVDEDVLAELAVSAEPDLRLRAAVHFRLPAEIRQALGTDPDWSVRQAVSAANPDVPWAGADRPFDDAELKILTAEQQRERQDLIQALEALNLEALEAARHRWLTRLERPRTVDEERLLAAHQGRVLELKRESRDALDRDLRILRQNLQAQAEREKRSSSLNLSRSLEQERQALREELKLQRGQRLLEAQREAEGRRMEELAALRAQQAMERQQVMNAERSRLSAELERFLDDHRAQLKAEADERLQAARTGLEQKLQTELADLREQLEGQALRELETLRAAQAERLAARQQELEDGLERLLDDQRMHLQAEADERLAREKETVRQDTDFRLARQESEARTREDERTASERARQQVELAAQREAALQEWRTSAEETLARRQADGEREAQQALSALAASMQAEHEQRLEQQRQQLEAEFGELHRARFEQLQRAGAAERLRRQQELSAELEAGLAEQRRHLESEHGRQLEALLAEHAAGADARAQALDVQVAQWRQQGELAREQVREQERLAWEADVLALKASFAAEHQQALHLRRQQLELEFQEEERVHLERQRQSARAAETQLRQQAEFELEVAWAERASALRAAHEADLARQLTSGPEREPQAAPTLDLQAEIDRRAEQLAADLALQRQATLTARGTPPEPEGALSSPLPGTPAVVGAQVGGYLVPADLLPTNPEPVLAALRLILAHLDVQEAALDRLTPDGQSRRSFRRSVDRVVEGFVHGQEHVILRADREDGPHYFFNERVPRLTP